MFFHVRELELRPGRFDVAQPPGVIEFLDKTLRQAAPLVAAGRVELVSGSLGEIRVRGHLKTVMEAECDRCLETARFPLDCDFELYYRPAAEGWGEETELDASEADMGFYEGDGLELNDVLREQVHLALPMQRLCAATCKGICPQCGRNRNLEECRCAPELAEDRWAALRAASVKRR